MQPAKQSRVNSFVRLGAAGVAVPLPWSGAVWYSPSNKKVKLDAKYDAKLYNTEAKVAQLIQVDWKWYNERKDDIDARVTRILRG